MGKAGVHASQEEFVKGLTAHEKYGIKRVLCHGDVWSDNVYYERGLPGKPKVRLPGRHNYMDYTKPVWDIWTATHSQRDG